MVIILLSNVEWKISNTLINYDFAISEMQKRIIKLKIIQIMN